MPPVKKTLCALFLLPCLGCASAPEYRADYRGEKESVQVAGTPAAGGGYPRQTTINFDDDAIEGDLVRPDGAYLEARRRLAEAPAAPPAETAPSTTDAPDPEVSPDPQKRLVIYTGDYTVMTANIDQAVRELIALAESFGGYLQRRQNGEVTVRVPAERFFELTGRVPSWGIVTHESMQASDVTKQFLDLGLRIETAEKSRARLLELLARAIKMEDILRIEEQVRRLTEEIETMKGELRYLSDQIGFSTLAVRFLANAPQPSAVARRTQSRFPWVNAVGIERVLYDF